MTPRNRKRNGADELEMAHEALEMAKVASEKKGLRTAISRAYYAAFHTAKAALMARAIQVKRHPDVLERFRSKLVGCGPIAERHGDILMELLEMRGVADYGLKRDAIVITESLAARLVADAEIFVRDVEAWTRAEWGKMGDE